MSALRSHTFALHLQLEDMEEGSNNPSSPSSRSSSEDNAERDGEGEHGSYSAWEAAAVYSPTASHAGASPLLGPQGHDARHSSDSFSSASTNDALPFFSPLGGKGPNSPRSPPSPESPSSPVEFPRTPRTPEEKLCASKVMTCCESPYVKGNAKVKAFVMGLIERDSGAVCKFFTRLSASFVINVPKMIAPMVRPGARSIPKKWSAGRILGRGAFGECSLAMDHDTGRLMAVKRIKVMGSAREVAESVKALRQEVDVLSSLHHPHVVGAIGVSFDAGGGDSEHELHSHTNSTGFQAGGGDAVPVVSIWMDFMEGGSLSSIIAEFGALPEKVPAPQPYTLNTHSVVARRGYRANTCTFSTRAACSRPINTRILLWSQWILHFSC